METKKNDSLVEFELQDAQMNDVMGGKQTIGYSGGHITNGMWCAGDRGIVETQEILVSWGCEPL